MGRIPRWAAAPVLRAWVASKSDEVDLLPRPVDAPQSFTAGARSIPVHIFGGGLAVGWGVLSHDIALPGALSRALSRRTGRGADVSVTAVPRLKAASARSELDTITLNRYEAVVISLGVNDAGALTPLRSWERDLRDTLRSVRERARPDARVFLAGVHPIRSIPLFDSRLGSIADAHARQMNEISAEVCRELGDVTFVPMTAPEPCEPLRFRDAMSYRHWADELAASMAPQVRAQSNGPPRFDEVIARARISFGVRSATVSVIDRDRLVHKAQLGDVPQLIMLRASFTASVVGEGNGMVIPDATLDPRFRDLPHVFGYPRIRFYAGFPLESPDGSRIGTLNLFDPAPRLSNEPWRRDRLREFGLMAQAELLAS